LQDFISAEHKHFCLFVLFHLGSVAVLAERVKAPFLRDLGSTPTLIAHVVASLDKSLYDDYLCLMSRTSSKFSGKNSKKQPENSKMDNF